MKHGKVRIRWKNVLLGTGVGTLILICSSAAAAGLMAKGAVDIAHMDLFASGILAASAMGGCLAALLGGCGLLEGILTAAGQLVVLFALNAGLNGGEVEGALATILVLAGGSGGAMLLTMGSSGGRKTRRRKRKNR